MILWVVYVLGVLVTFYFWQRWVISETKSGRADSLSAGLLFISGCLIAPAWPAVVAMGLALLAVAGLGAGIKWAVTHNDK